MIDLNPNHLGTVKAILAEHASECEVRAFGSRATWTAKDYSDLDLAIVGSGPLARTSLEHLKEAFEESDLPMRVDVLDWHSVSDSFRKVIEQEYVVLQDGMCVDGAVPQRVRPQVKLGSVATIVMGQSPPGSTVSDEPGVALLNGPTEFGAHHPVPVQFTSDPRKFAQPGDVLFCVRGSTTGRMNWADQEYAIGRGVAAIRHTEDPTLQPLLRGVIEVALPELLIAATGSTFPNVSASQIADIPYPEMDLEEQRALAHILGTLDDKIELNRRMSETLEAMAQALYKSWFMDFEPVRAKMEGHWRRGESLTGLPAKHFDLFPDRLRDSELGEVPEGWEIGVLDDAVEIFSGGTPKTSVSAYWGGEIPWYTPKDAPNGSEVFAIDTERSITPLGLENSSTQVLPAKTTVISARGTVGRLACLGVPMAMNQTCYGIRGLRGYTDFFTYWNIRAALERLQTRTHGTIFDTITRQTFTVVEAVLPPIKLTSEFEATVAPLMDRILDNCRESKALATQRDTLLPRLVGGKLAILGPRTKGPPNS